MYPRRTVGSPVRLEDLEGGKSTIRISGCPR